VTQLTVAAPKPELVSALRATWRKSAQHAAEQASRFVRLTVVAAVPSLVNLIQGGKFDWRTLLAFVLPFAEVAWRQAFPAMGAANADAADGVTIVPEQVGAEPDSVPPAAASEAVPWDPAPDPANVPDVAPTDGPLTKLAAAAKPSAAAKAAVKRTAAAKKTATKKS
jgi:hypothetical protein